MASEFSIGTYVRLLEVWSVLRTDQQVDALAVYWEHNKWFNVYTHTSIYQLGTCIIQQGQPGAYFSHKLSNGVLNSGFTISASNLS